MAYWFTTDWHGIKEFYPKVKEIIKPKDTVIFGGDANDRGPDGWELIKTILKDDQFIYIRGNHEQMLIDACREGDTSLLFYNGGADTYFNYENDEWGEKWINYLNKMTVFQHTYTNEKGQLIYITHSGYWGTDDYDKIWDRTHCNCEWDNPDCDIIVHGHTPVCHIHGPGASEEIFNAPYWYCDDRKCGVDVGSYATKRTILLNLDTWEYHLIKI